MNTILQIVFFINRQNYLLKKAITMYWEFQAQIFYITNIFRLQFQWPSLFIHKYSTKAPELSNCSYIVIVFKELFKQ